MSLIGRCSVLAAVLFAPAPLPAQNATAGFARVVEDAWHAVDSTYYDATFHGIDWPAVRDSFLAREYTSSADAYAAIRDMLARLGNPATRFLTPEQAAAQITEFSGQSHDGIGLLELLSIDTDEKTGDIVIVTPIPGAPAARAGLRPGDILVSVNGESAKALGLAETMSRLRGQPRTAVHLTVRREDETFDVRIERERLAAITPVEGFVRNEQGRKVGYIGLRQFTAESPARLHALLGQFATEGVAAYVLDLRNNPGGLVPAVQQIAGIFLGEVPIARIRNRSHNATPLPAQGEQRVQGPVVVLVNEGSASAAEVLAGAFQSIGRGKIIGSPTFGKGLAHGFLQLSDGSAVMPTQGRLETLNGRDLLDHGLTPDVIVSASTSPVIDSSVDVATADDTQYRHAVELVLVRRE